MQTVSSTRWHSCLWSTTTSRVLPRGAEHDPGAPSRNAALASQAQPDPPGDVSARLRPGAVSFGPVRAPSREEVDAELQGERTAWKCLDARGHPRCRMHRAVDESGAEAEPEERAGNCRGPLREHVEPESRQGAAPRRQALESGTYAGVEETGNADPDEAVEREPIVVLRAAIEPDQAGTEHAEPPHRGLRQGGRRRRLLRRRRGRRKDQVLCACRRGNRADRGYDGLGVGHGPRRLQAARQRPGPVISRLAWIGAKADSRRGEKRRTHRKLVGSAQGPRGLKRSALRLGPLSPLV